MHIVTFCLHIEETFETWSDDEQDGWMHCLNNNNNTDDEHESYDQQPEQDFREDLLFKKPAVRRSGPTRWWEPESEHKQFVLKAKAKNIAKLPRLEVPQESHSWPDQDELYQRDPWEPSLPYGHEREAGGSEPPHPRKMTNTSLMSLIESRRNSVHYSELPFGKSAEIGRTPDKYEALTGDGVPYFTYKPRRVNIKPTKLPPKSKPISKKIWDFNKEDGEPRVTLNENNYTTSCNEKPIAGRYLDRHARCHGHVRVPKALLKARRPRKNGRPLPRNKLFCTHCKHTVSIAEKYGLGDAWPSLERPYLCTCEFELFPQEGQFHKDVPLMNPMERSPSLLLGELVKQQFEGDADLQVKLTRGTIPHFTNFVNPATVYAKTTNAKLFEGTNDQLHATDSSYYGAHAKFFDATTGSYYDGQRPGGVKKAQNRQFDHTVSSTNYFLHPEEWAADMEVRNRFPVRYSKADSGFYGRPRRLRVDSAHNFQFMLSTPHAPPRKKRKPTRFDPKRFDRRKRRLSEDTLLGFSSSGSIIDVTDINSLHGKGGRSIDSSADATKLRFGFEHGQSTKHGSSGSLDAHDLSFFEMWEAFTHAVGAKDGKFNLQAPQTEAEKQRKAMFMKAWRDFVAAITVLRAVLAAAELHNLAGNRAVMEACMDFFTAFERFLRIAWNLEGDQKVFDESAVLDLLDPETGIEFLMQWKMMGGKMLGMDWAHISNMTDEQRLLHKTWKDFIAGLNLSPDEERDDRLVEVDPARMLDFFQSFRKFLKIDSITGSSVNQHQALAKEFATWLVFMQGLTGDGRYVSDAAFQSLPKEQRDLLSFMDSHGSGRRGTLRRRSSFKQSPAGLSLLGVSIFEGEDTEGATSGGRRLSSKPDVEPRAGDRKRGGRGTRTSSDGTLSSGQDEDEGADGHSSVLPGWARRHSTLKRAAGAAQTGHTPTMHDTEKSAAMKQGAEAESDKAPAKKLPSRKKQASNKVTKKQPKADATKPTPDKKGRRDTTRKKIDQKPRITVVEETTSQEDHVQAEGLMTPEEASREESSVSRSPSTPASAKSSQSQERKVKIKSSESQKIRKMLNTYKPEVKASDHAVQEWEAMKAKRKITMLPINLLSPKASFVEPSPRTSMKASIFSLLPSYDGAKLSINHLPKVPPIRESVFESSPAAKKLLGRRPTAKPPAGTPKYRYVTLPDRHKSLAKKSIIYQHRNTIFNISISQKSCRFFLPDSILELEKMTAAQYLQNYVTPDSTRKYVFDQVFNNHKLYTEVLDYTGIQDALHELYPRYLGEADATRVLDLVSIFPSSKVDYNLFVGVAAFAERMIFPKLAKALNTSSIRSKYERSDMEELDFRFLDMRLQNLNVQPQLKEILTIIDAQVWDNFY